jgi:tight adherence protein B
VKIDLLLMLLSAPVVGGIGATWLWARRAERGTIAQRLARLAPSKSEFKNPLNLLKQESASANDFISRFQFPLPGIAKVNSILAECGWENHLDVFLLVLFTLIALPILASIFLAFNLLFCVLASAILSIVPFIVITTKADLQRTKFAEQLPDAIDLMVAILRSGHSVGQAVKAVAEDIPAPCGAEFEAVLHRMNLGLPLSEALIYSVRRWDSSDLDLLRKAVAIQFDVGGSLAELLEKTNETLRQRLKLARQLRTITAQSRLSAKIVGALPFVLAIALNFLSPGYLQTLSEDSLGQMLLCLVIALQVAGILVMRQMSTMRV